MTMRYVGIDFEYASDSRGSICAYGLAFEDGTTEHGFVRLHPDNPLQLKTRFHGITQAQTDGGLGFEELYARLAELTAAGDIILVAHDLKSDRRAFQAAQLQHSLEALPLAWVDSLPIARAEVKASKIPGKTGIAAMAERYGMPGEHHNPAYDAMISLEIVLRNPPSKNIIRDIDILTALKGDASLG